MKKYSKAASAENAYFCRLNSLSIGLSQCKTQHVRYTGLFHPVSGTRSGLPIAGAVYVSVPVHAASAVPASR